MPVFSHFLYSRHVIRLRGTLSEMAGEMLSALDALQVGDVVIAPVMISVVDVVTCRDWPIN